MPTFSSRGVLPGVRREPSDNKERRFHAAAVEHVDKAGRDGISLLPNST